MSMEKNITLMSYDIQPDGNVKASSVLKYFQQIAREDLDEIGLTYHFMRSRNMVFVLTTLNLEIYEPLKSYDVLLIKTWPHKLSGISFYRDFSVYKENRLVAACATCWVLLDFAERKPLRPSALNFDIPHFPDRSCGVEINRSIRLSGEMNSLPSLCVTYSLLDENNHLNNSYYADIITDSLPIEYFNEGKRIYSLQIAFRHEARWHDELELARISDCDLTFITAKNAKNGNECFHALVKVVKD